MNDFYPYAFGFPDANEATPEGLVAIGGDLSPERLIMAYERGIYPCFSENEPILWWSQDPRGIIPLDGVVVNRTLRKEMAKNRYEIRVNTAFHEVITHCALIPRKSGARWITDDMIEAYDMLFHLGYAHSVEAWEGDALVGGLYGVSLGGFFAGESMFALRPNASKIALLALVERMKARGFTLLDCQMVTETTGSLGAIKIRRREYLSRLESALDLSCSFAP